MEKKEFKPTGYYCVSNCGGIECEINWCGDGVRYRWTYGNPKEKVSRWQEIKYTAKGRAYFVCNRRRYYLDEFMRY